MPKRSNSHWKPEEVALVYRMRQEDPKASFSKIGKEILTQFSRQRTVPALTYMGSIIKMVSDARDLHEVDSILKQRKVGKKASDALTEFWRQNRLAPQESISVDEEEEKMPQKEEHMTQAIKKLDSMFALLEEAVVETINAGIDDAMEKERQAFASKTKALQKENGQYKTVNSILKQKVEELEGKSKEGGFSRIFRGGGFSRGAVPSEKEED